MLCTSTIVICQCSIERREEFMTTLKPEHGSVGWGLFLQWVLANTVIWAIGFFAGCNIGGPTLGGAFFGASVVFTHWLVLRQHLVWTKRWVVANIIIGAVVGTISFAVSSLLGEAIRTGGGPVAIGATFGASLGIMQWLALRPKAARAGWWVLASTVGTIVGMVLGFAASCAVSHVAGAVGGAAVGTITGVALLWLLQQPIRET